MLQCLPTTIFKSTLYSFLMPFMIFFDYYSRIEWVVFSLREVRKALTITFLLSIKTTSQTKIFYSGLRSRSDFEQETSVSSVRQEREAHDWMRYSENDCSVTRMFRKWAIGLESDGSIARSLRKFAIGSENEYATPFHKIVSF